MERRHFKEGSPERWEVVALRRCPIKKKKKIVLLHLCTMKSVGWRNEILFRLVHAMTGLQVWVGEIITKHLYFRKDLE